MIDEVSARSTTLARARASLCDARSELDDAVSSLPQTDGETVVVSSELVILLLRVVAAKHHLEEIERLPNARPMASLA